MEVRGESRLHINLVCRANEPAETLIEQRLGGEPAESDCSQRSQSRGDTADTGRAPGL